MPLSSVASYRVLPHLSLWFDVVLVVCPRSTFQNPLDPLNLYRVTPQFHLDAANRQMEVSRRFNQLGDLLQIWIEFACQAKPV